MKVSIKLSKTDKIMALINQWDPEGLYAKTGDYRAYSYEADTIAQQVRANSKVATVEKYIREAFDLDEPDDITADDDTSRTIHVLAECIINAVKR